MFAIIETGGKQYKVAEGEAIKVEKLPAGAGGPKPGKENTITFDKVLMVDDGKKTTVGTPYIKDAKITAEFLEQGRHKKVTVLKFKNKTRYKKVQGHKQPFTKVRIKGLK